MLANLIDNADEQTKYDVMHTLVDGIELSRGDNSGIKAVIDYRFGEPQERIAFSFSVEAV